MSINYAQRFERQIEQQFARELTSADMERNKKYSFIDAKTIKIPTIILSGYKDHARDGTKKSGTISNIYQPMTLEHDRDIQFYVDEMDVDETNQVLSAANLTSVFNSEQAIPELDSYRYSKLYTDFRKHSGVVNTTLLNPMNILIVFDEMMESMDEAGVPESGRILKVTPVVYTMLKNADKLQRTIDVTGGARAVNRNVRSLDEVEITKVPSDRMKTAYNFSNGCIPADGALQINMMLYHTDAILAPVKVSDIYLWNKGETPDSAYGYLYQNRLYTDLFAIQRKIGGIAINAQAAAGDVLSALYFDIAPGSTEAATKLTIYDIPASGDYYMVIVDDGSSTAITLPDRDTTKTALLNADWAVYVPATGFAAEEGNVVLVVKMNSDDKAIAGGMHEIVSGEVEE